MNHRAVVESSPLNGLSDRFGRRITYVRLSITDRCDLRCVYCMSEGMRFLPRNQLLTLEELARVGRCFNALGVTRLRLTGGEPLVRRNALWLFEQLGALPTLQELTLTTNGTQLARAAAALKAAGVARVNISLDSLRPERFRAITRGGVLQKTLAGIAAACAVGFERVKLNSVISASRNQDEVLDLARFAIAHGIDISFIEEMPLGDSARRAEVYSSTQIRRTLEQALALLPTDERTGGPATYFRVAGTASRIGLIAPHSHNFCADCNRVRVTAAGQLLLCLGHTVAVDLRRVLRAHPGDDERVKQALVAAMALKPWGHQFGHTDAVAVTRHMNMTGG
ncbi:GTP 3',8-cyclase MoaA [Chromatium okenii]|uniref:GTP 3',8-cyclase MoaA n=1 Tax=Chromatium okenii TaxID=61644 RepID=UPI001906BA89|nr:GTP 3',8-cyclase MoaA [Chromatium okenii]MBK1641645.1 GTP 3',8-cyclase MoaA [Chromatium okenii]